jgi:PAS domain S-box-containing protein
MDAVEAYGIFTLNAAGIVETWNRGSTIVQSYTAEETLGKPFGPLYELEAHKQAGYFDHVLKSALDHGFFEEEGWRERKNGSFYWASLVITPIYDNDGKLLMFTVISRDITSKKLAAEISEISETQRENPVLSTSNIAWIRGVDGQFLSPHLQWENYTGQRWPDYQGFGWLKMHPPEQHDKIKMFWKHLQCLDWTSIQDNCQILQKPEVNTKLTLRTQLWSSLHKEHRHVIMAVVPEMNSNGRVLQWVGNEKDVHRTRHTEDELRRTVTRQHLILSSCRLGLFELKLADNSIQIDEFIGHLFAIDMTSFRNQLSELMARVHPDDRSNLSYAMDQAMLSGEPFHAEFKVLWPDKAVRHLVWKGKVLYDSTNHASSIMGTGWDVTETRELIEKQAQLVAIEKQQKEQGELVDSICHELRNPLNGIIGYVEELKVALQGIDNITPMDYLREGPKDAIMQSRSLLQSSIEVIGQCSLHQRNVIDQMLEISTLDSGHVTLSEEPFCVESEIQSVVTMHQPILSQKSLKPTFRFPPQPIHVLSDKTRFKQVLMNLVSNAVHNSPESGEIKIHVRLVLCTEINVVFEICIAEHGGSGYTPQDISNLLDRYIPIINHKTTAYESRGLGLAVSKRLTQLLGGTIRSKVNQRKVAPLFFNFP